VSVGVALGVAFVIFVLAFVVLAVMLRRRARPTAGASPPALAPTVGDGLGARVRSLFGTGRADPWGPLEALLVRADVGPTTSARIVADVRERYGPGDDPAALVGAEIRTILGEPSELELPTDRLGVILVVGVNGSGKTTTIGKLARRLTRGGRAVSLAGSDTFRAAASEQLRAWAERSGAHLVTQARGADPGSVVFDAVQAARARGSDVLIVDTAGRLHTKRPLMEELAKVHRVLVKAVGRPPDETLLVLDATTGQNGIVQAQAFTRAVEVTGVALAKLDGTARGGVVVAVRDRLGLPVKLIGTGEGADDLEPFDPGAFTDRLLGG
jgi:fused signal recognition particle receptor